MSLFLNISLLLLGYSMVHTFVIITLFNLRDFFYERFKEIYLTLNMREIRVTIVHEKKISQK